MSFLISLALPFILCVVMAGTTSLLWWKALGSPVLFGVAAFLATLGLHRLLQAIVEFVKLFTHGGYFLEVRGRPDVVQLAKESLNTETVIVCVLLIAIGLPLLYLLRTAMVKA